MHECPRGQNQKNASSQTEELLATLDLAQVRKQSLRTLSGGLLRMTHFAMALMGHPRLVVLDEPTNELDPYRRRLVWDTIAQLNREKKMTCVLATHNFLEGEKVGHRVGVIQAGRMLAIGTPSELKSRYGRGVRLDLHLQEGASLTDENRKCLVVLGRVDEISPLQFRCYLDPLSVSHATDLIARSIGFDRLENFRLSPPSLEEIYLHLDFSASPDLSEPQPEGALA